MSIVLPATEVLLRSDFYVTGGTLRPDAPSYVERSADRALCEGLLNGEFCYVLTSRQMGKSSLMVRTVRRLREEKVAVAVLDLTAIGQNLTIEQWYDGLAARLGQQLKLEEELEEFWESHAEWGPLQRWTSALENVVLQRLSSEVVIFVDEIDIVRSLPFSTDEFFAGIRECYNRRAHQPAFNRLAFSLLGVATPTDLIRDTRMTPFNIGRRIELNDFTPQEAAPLAKGLGADEATSKQLLARVLYWTGGHPYLTQRLCRGLAESIHVSNEASAAANPGVPPLLPTPRDVDRLAEKMFLSRQARDRDDNLIFVRERLLRNEVDVPALLLLYRKIHIGELVTDDETNALVSILHLAGVAKGVNGFLEVRNRIYRQVFDLAWIQTNMPAAEVRRQRRAGRRGMFIGFGIATVLLLGYVFLVPLWTSYHEASLARQTVQRLPETYRSLKSYRDTFETTMEIGVNGSPAAITGSGSLLFEAPNKVNLALKSGFNSPEMEVRILSDGLKSMLYAPALRQIQVLGIRPEPGAFELPAETFHQLGPIAVLPVFRLLLDGRGSSHFLRSTHDVEPRGSGSLDGQPARIVAWKQEAGPFLRHLGIHDPAAAEGRIPVTAWVNASNNLVLRLEMDLSPWAGQLAPSDVPITGLVIKETHKGIEARRQNGRPGEDLRWNITGEVQPVDHLTLPRASFSDLGLPREFTRLIPPRLPFTPVSAIDLSDYYNAALAETWHPGTEHNTLEMLPTGLLELGGSFFDVRGIVQLAGKQLPDRKLRYPAKVTGIKVNQACRHLQFLYGTGWRAREGTPVAAFIIRYADGRQETIPLVYGEDLRDWNAVSDPSTKLTRGKIVWRARNDANFSVRLFQLSWLNPAPEAEIATLDFVSAMADPAPFLIAVTAEP